MKLKRWQNRILASQKTRALDSAQLHNWDFAFSYSFSGQALPTEIWGSFIHNCNFKVQIHRKG